MKKRVGTAAAGIVKRNAIMIILLVMMAFFQIRNPNFLSMSNVITIFRQGACTGILAVGLGIVLVVGGIDLSIGALVSMTSVILGCLTVEQGWPVWAASPDTA